MIIAKAGTECVRTAEQPQTFEARGNEIVSREPRLTEYVAPLISSA